LFSWSSFLELPSLRHVCIQFDPHTSLAGSDSKVLRHLLVPIEYKEKVLQHSLLQHEWNRTRETDSFALTLVYAKIAEDKPTISPLPLDKWIQELAELVKASPSVTEVSALNVPELGTLPEFVSILPHSSIQKFDTPNYSRTLSLVPALASALPNCPSLTDLTIFEDYNHSFSSLLRQLSSANLQRLELVDGLNEQDWQCFLDVLPNLRLSSFTTNLNDIPSFGHCGSALNLMKDTLTELRLWSVTVESEAAQMLVEPLRVLNHLQFLGLPMGIFPDEILPILLPSLVNLTITTLTLFGSFNPRSIDMLAGKLALFRNLRSLELRFEELEEEDWDEGWPELLEQKDWATLFSSLPPTLCCLQLREPFEVTEGFGDSVTKLPKSLTLFEVDYEKFYPDRFGEILASFPNEEPHDEDADEEPRNNEGVEPNA
jgi:hypothetical protein